MQSVVGNLRPSFYRRLLKLYLPLFFIGISGLAWISLNASPNVRAAGTKPATQVVYPGSYTSPAGFAPQYGTPPRLSCQPDTGFGLAGPITASAGQTGLSIHLEPVYYHPMYGYTDSQLAELSRRCPLIVPGDSKPYINAYTSYWVGWNYDYSSDSDGLCRPSNVQVMVNIHQSLPIWQNLNQASPKLQADWQAYLAAVSSHENGHLQLVQQYSGQLLAGLQSFTPTACGSIEQAVNDLANGYIGQLKQADAAYEAATQSGATQGAIVP